MTKPNQKELEWYDSELDPTHEPDNPPSLVLTQWGVGAAVTALIALAIAVTNHFWG